MFNTKKFWGGAFFGATTFFLTYISLLVWSLVYLVNHPTANCLNSPWKSIL